jgi:late competence protein required for DNA uptake (superfamily II DNA/RNA helicase)
MMQSEKSQAKINIYSEVGVKKREVAIPNEKELECEICCELIPEYRMAKLFHCEHMFCEECLMSYLMLKISRSEEIRCFAPECSGELDEGSAIIASLTPSELKKYKKIKFKSLIR